MQGNGEFAAITRVVPMFLNTAAQSWAWLNYQTCGVLFWSTGTTEDAKNENIASHVLNNDQSRFFFGASFEERAKAYVRKKKRFLRLGVHGRAFCVFAHAGRPRGRTLEKSTSTDWVGAKSAQVLITTQGRLG